MADANGHAPSGVNPETEDDPIRLLAEAPERFDFFQAVRLIEARFADRPALGEGRRARAEPVRLGQPPHLTFPPAQIAGFEPGGSGRPAHLSTYVMGLFGPHGPLPLHLTVHARDRQRRFGDPTFARFCDIFHHRMLALYYRAWARARPTVAQDRPGEDRFQGYVGAIAGLAAPAFRDRQALPDRFVAFGAGLFAMGSRPPEALARLIQAYFRVPVRIEEFTGAWLTIPEHQRSRLGSAQLAVDAIAGVESFQRQQRFRVRIGPVGLAAFLRFLPDGSARGRLEALVRLAAGPELDWDVRLVLKRDQVPAARLDGTGRLGWTSWLHARARADDAGDLVLDGQ